MEPDTAKHKRDMLFNALDGEDALYLKIAEAIPEDQVTWKPDVDKTWRTNDLALHGVGTGLFFTSVVDGNVNCEEPMPAAPEDKAALLDAIRGAQAAFRSQVGAYTPEKLAEETGFFGNTYTNIEILSWQREHMIHHRAQLALYLRLMGAQVPATYGPSGDDDMS